MKELSKNVQQPLVVKYVQSHRNGIQSHYFSRNGIGYVFRGKKYIYYGDVRYEVNRGEMFYLNVGNHYIEDIPEDGKPFEQIVFFYTSDLLGEILTGLSLNYHLHINNNHSCDNCSGKSHVVYPAWNSIKSFFGTINQYIKDDEFSKDIILQEMKITELIYLVVSNPDCCIKNKVLDNVDMASENFERTIQDHIFSDISIEELARICNKSLTSFKKEFKKHFHEPPHKWLIKQRLMHSRLLLISTNKSVSEIGNECNFSNTSHYIKLFKKEYEMTPANYRAQSRTNKPVEAAKKQKVIA